MDVVVKVAKKSHRGNKNRKYGRNKVKCARYRAEGRREKNKARKARKRERRLLKAKQKREANASL